MQDATKADTTETWDILRRMLVWFVALFGAPSAIALKRFIPRALRDRAVRLLRGLEKRARLLLLRDALRAAPENAIFPPKGFPSPSYRAGRGGFGSDESAQWGVVFRLAPSSSRRSRKGRVCPRRPPPRMVGACALAERLEALLRVTRDPARWARRLALRFRRHPEKVVPTYKRMRGRRIIWPSFRPAYAASG